MLGYGVLDYGVLDYSVLEYGVLDYGMTAQVFICHSSKDKRVAGAACAALEQRGIPCWIAPRDVLAGVEYGEAIVDAIAACPILLVIFSAPANHSPQVRREIERAVSKGKAIIPFRIEDAAPTGAMEYALSSTHWLDAFEQPVERYLPTLCRTVSALLERVAPLSPAPSSAAREPAIAPSSNPYSRRSVFAVGIALALVLASAAGLWLRHSARQQWAREQAVPQIASLLDEQKSVAASDVLATARKYLPADDKLKQLEDQNSRTISVHSTPLGATVEIADYVTPTGGWHALGVTPLDDIRVPKGNFRWRISKPGVAEMVTAAETRRQMDFPLGPAQSWPKGMVLVPGHEWSDEAAFVGWFGPYTLPSYYIDRFEVTNRDFQVFVDSGGYQKQQYWTIPFRKDGHALAWNQAMAQFRDSSGRPGPATWVGGHFPEGMADYPVSGVSWYEAAAYAAFAGKALPTLAQWMDVAPPRLSSLVVPASNMSSKSLAPVGTYSGLGPYGTYDMAGNVGEWVLNTVDDDMRFVLGGSWKSPGYHYFSPETISSFDRSDENGFRCVKNLGALPPAVSAPVKRNFRDFSHFKPATDSVFEAYKLLYAYPQTPFHQTDEVLVNETADWREVKVVIDTGYRGERMAVYLFLPKNVRPPYQTVLFFPSARVLFIPDNKGGRELGDVNFFDYVVQSGRAVAYPVYENTYERQIKFSLPRGDQNIQLTTDWYKDAGRTLDYLATRPDIDSSKTGYLGVSMGSAYGVIVASLLQDRLKTAVFLDGGYFMERPAPGADQADFVTRMKTPVLMVNGRYDFTFPLERSQNPFFAMLGTPPAAKRHVVLDTPHNVTEQRVQLSKTVLDWMDMYLGRVE